MKRTLHPSLLLLWGLCLFVVFSHWFHKHGPSHTKPFWKNNGNLVEANGGGTPNGNSEGLANGNTENGQHYASSSNSSSQDEQVPNDQPGDDDDDDDLFEF